MLTKDLLRKWFAVYQQEFNLFEVVALCKQHNVRLLASDTNHTSCLVKYDGQKWHLSTFENTCQRA